uniref:Proteasome 20S subunit beta 10 n=1 Tax=Vombatus ursinus TaxID=29139 RepID=A0A4X2LRF3_VOMUR
PPQPFQPPLGHPCRAWSSLTSTQLKPCCTQPGIPRGGFSFENCQRNAFLESSLKGLRVPRARKTGTTIVGLVFEDGVILGSDTRSTNDSVVADKNCEKIHFIAPNIYYQGHIGASLIVGGVDITGPHLYSVHPHGSYSHLLFTAMGSGQGPAISVLEDRFKPNMTLEEGQQLVVEAVTAGILDDLGSGSNVDVCVITQAGVKIQRAVSTPAVVSKRQGKYGYPEGTTAVMKETVTPLALEMIEETVQTMEVE